MGVRHRISKLIKMAMINRNDLLKLGFEDSEGPVFSDNYNYIVVRYYIHKDKPWIGIEEHCPKSQGNLIDADHVTTALINYGTKKGEIVYSEDEIKSYLHHQGQHPCALRKK